MGSFLAGGRAGGIKDEDLEEIFLVSTAAGACLTSLSTISANVFFLGTLVECIRV